MLHPKPPARDRSLRGSLPDGRPIRKRSHGLRSLGAASDGWRCVSPQGPGLCFLTLAKPAPQAALFRPLRGLTPPAPVGLLLRETTRRPSRLDKESQRPYEGIFGIFNLLLPCMHSSAAHEGPVRVDNPPAGARPASAGRFRKREALCRYSRNAVGMPIADRRPAGRFTWNDLRGTRGAATSGRRDVARPIALFAMPANAERCHWPAAGGRALLPFGVGAWGLAR